MKKGIMLMLLAAITGFAFGQTKEERKLDGFSKVNFGVPGELYIEFGRDFKVVLEGDRDDLEETVTEVTSGRLIIKRKRNWGNMDQRITVHITMPEISGLSVSGSGKAEITEDVKGADQLDLSVSGSGKLLTAGIDADRLECSISGSGNVIVAGGGSADSGEISISGSGNYMGESLAIDQLTVRLSGSGNCTCKAGDQLIASVSGSGHVNYYGNPKVDARISGSGKVRSR